MITAVCSAPCALQRRTESGLQARPLFFQQLQWSSFLEVSPSCTKHFCLQRELV